KDYDRRVEFLLDLLQRRISGDAGTGVGRGGDGIETLQVDQIFRVRDRHVIGITTVTVDADRVRLDRAHVLFAREAGRAFAAAEPGIGQRDRADLQSALVALLHVRAER